METFNDIIRLCRHTAYIYYPGLHVFGKNLEMSRRGWLSVLGMYEMVSFVRDRDEDPAEGDKE